VGCGRTDLYVRHSPAGFRAPCAWGTPATRAGAISVAVRAAVREEEPDCVRAGDLQQPSRSRLEEQRTGDRYSRGGCGGGRRSWRLRGAAWVLGDRSRVVRPGRERGSVLRGSPKSTLGRAVPLVGESWRSARCRQRQRPGRSARTCGDSAKVFVSARGRLTKGSAPAPKSNLDAGVGQHVRSTTVQDSSNDRRRHFS
jgi:hypothetical protein